MKFDIVQPIRFVILILKCLGLWQLNTKWKHIYLIYAYVLHFTFTLLTILSMWASVFTANDLQQFSESLYMSLTEAALLAKVINILNLTSEAVHFFDIVQSEELGLRSPEEMKIFQQAHRVFYAMGRIYIGASLCFVAGSFGTVAIGQKWVLPYPAWMPFNLHSDLFWWAYGFQLIGMVVTCLTNVSIDLLQSYFLHHLSLLYRLVGHRLARIGCNAATMSDRSEVHDLFLGDLMGIIKVHNTIKKITVKCQRFMSFPFFMQILLSALVLCFTGYQIKTTNPLSNPGQFIGMVDFLLIIGLQIYLPCYYGDQVTIESGLLCEALYHSNWTALPRKSRRLIFMYMEFLKEPVLVKAGYFFNIGIPIFSKTINNAYSCFAVLINMRDN